MKKVLLAFDGTHFSEGAFEFARRMNRVSPILATGVFLPQIDYANMWSYAGGMAGASYIPLLEGDQTLAVQKNILRFEARCRSNQMEYLVHRDFTEFALPALRKETRFADLLVLGSESFYENLGVSEPNESIKDALHHSECPVLIVPEKFEFPDTNILAYDGGEDSVFATKQFSYLFPELCANPSLLVYVKEDADRKLPDENFAEELVRRHFPNLELLKLHGNVNGNFHTWARDRQRAILISGAFGRSTISQILRKSFVSDIIRDHRLPVFIAHR